MMFEINNITKKTIMVSATNHNFDISFRSIMYVNVIGKIHITHKYQQIVTNGLILLYFVAKYNKYIMNMELRLELNLKNMLSYFS